MKTNIIKRNYHGVEVFRYPGKIIKQTDKGILVNAIFNVTRVVRDKLVLTNGDIFTEAYFYKKWFNIYQVNSSQDGTLKGWYCNICRPINFISGNIEYEDLELDLIVFPAGRQVLLDKEDFDNSEIPHSDKEIAIKYLDELKKLFMKINEFDVQKLI